MSNTTIPGAVEDEYTLSLGDILRMLRRRLQLIACLWLTFVGIAVGYSLAEVPKYEASAEILVGQAQEKGTSETNLSASDVQGLQILTKTVAEAIDSRRAARAVIKELNLSTAPGTLMDDLTVETVQDTQFVRVTYQGTDPIKVQQITNAYGEVASEQISEISSKASAIRATLWDRAPLPDQDNLVRPKPVRNVVLALTVATILGITLAYMMESSGGGLSVAEEVQRATRVPTIGIIPKTSGRSGKNMEVNDEVRLKRRTQVRLVDGTSPGRRPIVVVDPTCITSEAYRVMRTNLFHASANQPPRVILLTSVGPHEGKSTVCANLGAVLSQAGKRTLVMDCNLHTPHLHAAFGSTDSRGVVNVLSGEFDLREVLQEVLPNLKIAPAGPIPDNPGGLLESTGFADLVDQARQYFDHVLIDSSNMLLDSSPKLVSAEPLVLATHADGVLLVVDAAKMQTGSLQHVVRALDNVGATVTGTVLNNA